jgi:sporulation integral membrane protein YlbJ
MRLFLFRPTVLLAFTASAVMLMLLLFPTESLLAAERGVAIWWDILFPALFPFLVISEMMLGFGIVHFFGTLLDPIMRPLFRIPGIGGFVVAMGFASGYPVGARLTSQLWEQGLVTREEGERLVAFTTSSDPIFLIGAVSVGFFGNVGLAVVLAAAHYGGALLLGLFMRFHGRSAKPSAAIEVVGREPLLVRSLRAMHRARLSDGRPIGLLLQQAVGTSIRLIFVIGGLVVFFSVVIEALRISGTLQLLQQFVGSGLSRIGMPAPLSEAILSGLFEVTLGAKAAGYAAAGVPLVAKAAAAAFVLSWAGLSVHAQVVSILHHTNLRYAPFGFARLLHGVISAGLVLLLWAPLHPVAASHTGALAAWAPSIARDITRFTWQWAPAATVLVFVLFLTVIAGLAWAAALVRRLRA